MHPSSGLTNLAFVTHRSALTLQRSIDLLAGAQTPQGAIPASTVHELYQYGWLRDGSWCAYALDRAGRTPARRGVAPLGGRNPAPTAGRRGPRARPRRLVRPSRHRAPGRRAPQGRAWPDDNPDLAHHLDHRDWISGHSHPSPERAAEQAFDRLNPDHGVPADQHSHYGHQAVRDREAALTMGVRVAVNDSRQNDPNPVIWQPDQDYHMADALHAARQLTQTRLGPERLGPER